MMFSNRTVPAAANSVRGLFGNLIATDWAKALPRWEGQRSGPLSRPPFDVGEAEKLFPEGLSVWVLRVQVAVVIVLLQFLKMSAAEGYVIRLWGRKGDFATLPLPHLELLLPPVVIQHHLFMLFICEQGLSCRCPLSFLKQMTAIVCVRKKRRKGKKNHGCY